MRIGFNKIRNKILLLALLVLTGIIAAIFLTRSYSISKESRLSIDSLNLLSYQYRYLDSDKSLDYARRAANMAYDVYPDGYFEALNDELIMHCLFIDSNKADSIYNIIQSKARNQVELLVSEVYMMKLCAMSSRNLDFFNFYSRANQRIDRINEERNSLEERCDLRMNYIELEFHLAAAETFCNLQQREQAIHEINQIDVNGIVRNSPYLWMQYCYMLGFNKLSSEHDVEDLLLRSFDYLMQTHTIAVSEKALYYQALVLSAMSEMLIDKRYNKILNDKRAAVLDYLHSFYISYHTPDTTDIPESLPNILSRVALKLSQDYGSSLLEADMYRVRGEVMFDEGKYKQALSSLESALSCINYHHYISYPNDDNDNILKSYMEDSVNVDIAWTESSNVHTSSLSLAKIRERLSATYMALGDKQKSDYNRNIYIDLLEITSRDLSLESRYSRLSERENTLYSLLFLIIILIIVVVFATIVYARIWRKRTRIQVSMLRSMGTWLTSIALTEHTSYDYTLDSRTASWLEKERKNMESVLQPYKEWMQKNRMHAESLRAEESYIQEQYLSMKMKIAYNKRKNIGKRAKVALVHSITPFLDRMLREINRIVVNPEDHPQERLDYIDELAEKINQYNEVLAEWIKMNKGELSLHIESFELQQIFDIINKGHYPFVQKDIILNVDKTDAVIKADKALTLFMVSTLIENARKFTSSGGNVSLRAVDNENKVTIEVEDSGCGLSEEDVNLILNSKIFDASIIGKTDSRAKSQKGSGFGLLNCKGIISEYRKMGGLFSVCEMNITSKKGKGSIFSFSLPKGRVLCSLFLFFSSMFISGKDSVALHWDFKEATRYADSVYFSNISADYDKSLNFADTFFVCLNRYYSPFLPEACKNVALSKDNFNSSQELNWWNNSFKADYHLIMSVRNEIAIAALALHKWDLYNYNNILYTRFYKLLGQDYALEDFYKKKEKAANNMSIGIVLLIVLSLGFIIVFYIIYFRRRILFRLGMMKVLEVNRKMLNDTERFDDKSHLEELMASLLSDTFDGLKEIHDIEGIRMMIVDDKSNIIGVYTNGSLKYDLITDNLLEDACRTAKQAYYSSLHVNVYPLRINFDNEKFINLGAVALNYGEYILQKENVVLEEYIMTYLSIMIYETVICRARNQESLEIAEDEKRRTEYEEGRIRVQNQILDNCLSSIKHESMYYPSRIRQIVNYIRKSSGDERTGHIKSLYELAEYYKSIYTLLSTHADRQIESVFFVCRHIKVITFTDKWKNRVQKKTKRFNLNIFADVSVAAYDSENLSVSADETLLEEMIELVTDDFFYRLKNNKNNINILFRIEEQDRFVLFRLSVSEMIYTEKDVSELFIPDINHYPYLLCKEIIREHDRLNNFCGCRISVESLEEGSSLCFTLPKVQKYE